VLTNRAGTTDAGNQREADENRPCFYPQYALQADWNGDVLLCPQDWKKRVKLGNLSAQSLWDVWTGGIAMKHRMRLLAGKRNCAPCSGCNAAGTLHGKDHAAAWMTV
jgi:radical SAM protein with 4Fe4S-binding SPASM domain